MSSSLVKKIVSTETSNLDSLFNQKGKIYTFLNPVSYLTAIDNKDIFNQFDGIFADGSILVAAIKILYGSRITRRSFDMTSLAPKLFEFAEKNKKTIYIIASKQEQVDKAVNVFKNRYPNLQISGYRNGYFSTEEEIMLEVQHIVTKSPDFLIIGMGALSQEKFLLKVKEKGFKGIGFTCGGFIHQTSKDEIDYYPDWADKFNLRFIYRMYKEKHTRKRYIQAGFLFPLRFIYERFFCN